MTNLYELINNLIIYHSKYHRLKIPHRFTILKKIYFFSYSCNSQNKNVTEYRKNIKESNTKIYETHNDDV